VLLAGADAAGWPDAVLSAILMRRP
jgi:hypothetical protein